MVLPACHPFPSQRRPAFVAWLLGFLMMGLALTSRAETAETTQTAETAPADPKSGPMLRIVCVASPVEDQEFVLASAKEDGSWLEHGTVKLRSAFVTDWLPAAAGKLHLTVRGAEGLVSKCAFTYPDSARRALAVLLPDVAKQSYRADVLDPAKLEFAKGSTLVVNYSPLPGVVMLGSKRGDTKPGGRLVVTPAPGADGMFRMLVGYEKQEKTEKKLVACYDRYVAYNGLSRDFLLLLPDPALGMRVFNLAEFGPFE